MAGTLSGAIERKYLTEVREWNDLRTAALIGHTGLVCQMPAVPVGKLIDPGLVRDTSEIASVAIRPLASLLGRSARRVAHADGAGRGPRTGVAQAGL